MNKTALIKSMPKGMTASEIVDEAKKRGVKLSSQLVYMVRGKSLKKGPAGRKPSAALKDSALRRRGRPPKVTPLTEQEMRFVEMLLSIGFGRANEILGMFAKL